MNSTDKNKIYGVVVDFIHGATASLRALMKNLYKRAAPVILFCIIAIILIFLGYQAEWTGFNYRLEVKDQVPGKYLWDWMELLLIPIVGGLIGILFNFTQRKSELEIAEKAREKDREIAEKERLKDRAIALDRQRQEILRAYLDRMIDFLIKNDLRAADPHSGKSIAARSQTLTVLETLDGDRKRSLIRFLSEAKLITLDPVVKLAEADLSRANFAHMKLQFCNFKRADFTRTVMRYSEFSGSNLAYANFKSANLYRANFVNCDMTNTQFENAYLHRTTLRSPDWNWRTLERLT